MTRPRQGACQAIEDALVLARDLGQSGDVEASFRRYETQRMPTNASSRWPRGVRANARDPGAGLVLACAT